MALMVVHSGTSGMESISDVPYYLVLKCLTRSLICITVHQKFKDLLTPFWLFSAMPALMTTTNINSIVFGE